MKTGDKVYLAVSGHSGVLQGTIYASLDNGKVEVEYFLPGSFHPRYCQRWPREVVVLLDNVLKGE